MYAKNINILDNYGTSFCHVRAGQNYFYVPNFSDTQFDLCPRSGTQKKDEGNQSQCAPLIKKQLETIIFFLCYL